MVTKDGSSAAKVRLHEGETRLVQALPPEYDLAFGEQICVKDGVNPAVNPAQQT
jgi:hypothetical protein